MAKLASQAKQKPAAGQNVCEKWGLRGQIKSPLPNKKAPDAPRLSKKIPKKGASTAPALEALPLALTQARGWGDPLYPLRWDHLLGFSRNVWPQNKTRKGASELKPVSSRRVPKTRGPEWHPEKNAKKRDARPKGR